MYSLDTGVLVAWKSFFIMSIFYVQFTGVLVVWKSFFIMSIFYVQFTGVLVVWKSFFIMSIFYVQFRYWCLSCVEIIFYNVNFLCTV